MVSPSSSPETSYPDRHAVAAGRRAHGAVTPPSSKSITQRYLDLALLARLPLTIRRPLVAEDTELFAAALEACGMAVERQVDRWSLTPGPRPAGGEIFCGNGGTMLRFLTAALTVVPGRWILDGTPRLRERPIGPLVEALRRLGARLHHPLQEGYPPVEIDGGSLRGGGTSLDAGESSQYLSALLMAGLAAPREVTIEVTALTSSPYVDLTLQAIDRFGGRVRRDGGAWSVAPSSMDAAEVTVEGDFSSAAYPAAAAALTGGEVLLRGLDRASAQGDRGVIDLLERMGAEIAWSTEGVTVRGRTLRGLEADLSEMPDQVPTVAALAPFATGTTRLVNVPHLRLKESDRLASMARELARLGAAVEELDDGLVVEGVWARSEPPSARVEVETYGDHRIAMSLALTGLRRPGVVIGAPAVVAKSYPGFWRDLERLME